MKKIKRHYYLDLFRGFAFILMVIDHLIFDIVFFFSSYWQTSFKKTHYLNVIASALSDYRNSDLSKIIRIVFIVFIFLFVSGISSTLSRNITKRGFRLFLLALAITLVSIIISLIISNHKIIIYFGIIHLISICMLLTPLLKKLPRIWLGLLGIVIIILGFYFEIKSIRVDSVLLVPFNILPPTFATGDFYPILPYLGFYIFGVIYGEYYFKKLNKPRFTKKYKMNIFTYFGKNALVWYFIHQVILVVFLDLLTGIHILFK